MIGTPVSLPSPPPLPPPLPAQRHDLAFVLEERAALQAADHVRRSLPGSRWTLGAIMALSALAAVLFVHLVVEPGPWSLGVAAAGAGLGWWSGHRSARAATIRMLRATPGAVGPRTLRFEPDGVVVATPTVTSQLAWSGVHGIVDTGEAVVLLAGPMAIVPVPSAAFRDAEDRAAWMAAARAAVDAHGGGRAAEQPWRLPPVGFGGGRAVLTVVLAVAAEIALTELAYRWSDLAADLWWAGGGLLTTVAAVRVVTATRVRSAIATVWGGRPTWAHVGVGAALGLLIWFVDESLMIVIGGLWPATLGDSQAWIDDAMLLAPAATMVAVVLTGPIAEEVLFRGVLLRGLLRRRGVLGAVLLSSVAFALVHPSEWSPPAVLLLASTFVAGAIFAFATLRTGTLTAAVVAHVVANLAVTLFGFGFGAGGHDWVVPAGPDVPVTAFTLAVGDCADGYPDDAHHLDETRRWTDDDRVACDLAHDVEVYLRAPLTTVERPPEAMLADEADTWCYDAFAPYVDRDWETSDLDYLALVPSPDAWDAGARDVVCVLHELGRRQLEGTAAGSRR